MTAVQRLRALASVEAGHKVSVSKATLMASFPMYRDTIANLAVGKSAVLKVGAEKHKVTRVSEIQYTQEQM